jgi:hypothetical protein
VERTGILLAVVVALCWGGADIVATFAARRQGTLCCSYFVASSYWRSNLPDAFPSCLTDDVMLNTLTEQLTCCLAVCSVSLFP